MSRYVVLRFPSELAAEGYADIARQVPGLDVGEIDHVSERQGRYVTLLADFPPESLDNTGQGG